MSVKTQNLTDAFSDNVGQERAAELVEEAAREAGLRTKRQYSKDEAMEIATQITDLEDTSTFVRISANTLKTRLRSDNI
jgi:glutathionylspermidine synthase